MQKTIAIGGAGAVIALVVTAVVVTRPGAPVLPNTDRLPVVATFYPLAHFAAVVGGAHVQVHSITPSGVEPHDFEPTLQDIRAVQSARIFLYNGAGFDPWAEKIAPDLRARGIAVLKAASVVPLLSTGEDGDEDGAGGAQPGVKSVEPRGAEEYDGTWDPHFWLDPVLAQLLVGAVRDTLINADAAHAEVYRANAAAYDAELRALDAAYRDGLADCRIREAVSSHAAFGYLAQRYDLRVFAISGLSPEHEPSPRAIADLADLARANGIQYIFFETLVSPKLADTIAREVGAQTLVFNPLEGLTPEEERRGETYLSLMRQNLDNLRTALQCQ